MYPFITVWGVKIYMTGIGIIVSLITFIAVVKYLSKKYLQGFRKFFYRLPLAITLVYFLGSYTQFVLSNQTFIPTTTEAVLSILSPHGYRFHFAGILLGLVIALFIFFKKIKTIENRKIWADIFFYAFTLSMVPLGIFLLLGDNFMGMGTDSFLGIKALHSESQRNKVNAVYPIGLFLSIGSLILALVLHIRKESKKMRGFGMMGLALLLILINLILMMQQYPRYIVFSMGDIYLDIKQHVSFFVIMYCIYLHRKWSAYKPILDS